MKLKLATWNVQKQLLCILIIVLCFKENVSQNYRDCEPQPGVFAACFPSPERIFQNVKTTITLEPQDVTCGETAVEYYRHLGDTSETFDCPVGDHVKELMIDAPDPVTFWQSKTWTVTQYDATVPNHSFMINITFSIQKKYRMSERIILTFNSGRPQQMLIERSADKGQTWQPLQYYARSCEDDYPGVPTTISASNPAVAFCTEEYSRDNVLIAGSTVELPGAGQRLGPDSTTEEYYLALQDEALTDFFTFTDIRVTLVYPATDGRERTRQAVDFFKYYYAISNIEVTGSCFCNLHAKACMTSSVTNETVCDCSHNTDGVDCEMCLPLYNNKPYKPGNFSVYPTGTANPCEKCECNDHAPSCTYDEILRFGVCNNCTHNTTGNMCEQCLDTFYSDPSLPLNDTNVCQDCNCEQLGALDPADLSCEKNRFAPNVGQCRCKALVTGRRCDLCISNFYGLLLPDRPGECKPCACNAIGTVAQSNICNATDGQCPCKASIEGRTCSQCRPGYYNFPVSTSLECTSCGCDPGGSTTPVCEPGSGICECKPFVTSTKCNLMISNYYMPALDDFLLQPVSGTCLLSSDLWTMENPFDGNVFAKCDVTTPNEVNFEPITGAQEQFALTWPYHLAVRYSLMEVISVNGASVEVTIVGVTGTGDLSKFNPDGTLSTFCPLTTGTAYTVPINFINGNSTAVIGEPPIPIDVRCTYSVRLIIPPNENITYPLFVDSIVLFPTLSDNATQTEFRTLGENSNAAMNYQNCIQRMGALKERSNQAIPTTGICGEILWSMASEVYGAGKPCDCDPTGTRIDTCNNGTCTCEGHGGQCACKSGVGGRRCDACTPGYYNFTSSGCLQYGRSRSSNASTLTTPAPSVSSEFTGMYIGLGLGLAAIFLVCIVIIVLCPKRGLRKSCCCCTFGNKVVQVVPNRHGENFGAHDPRNTFHRDDNNPKLNWMNPSEDDGKNAPCFVNTTNNLNDDDEFHSIYQRPRGHTVARLNDSLDDVSSNSSQHVQNIHPEDVDDTNFDYQNDFEMDIIPPPPSFNTFKSDNPITLPVITVSKPRAPQKPKRKKKPKRDIIEPVKILTFVDNPDNFNRLVDNNKQNEILLNDQNKIDLYADFDGFDEVNGSLV